MIERKIRDFFNKIKEVIVGFDQKNAKHILAIFMIGCILLGIGIQIISPIIIVPSIGILVAAIVLTINNS